MQALATVTTVFAFVAIAIHVYIWIIESFLWTKPKGRETFGMTEEFAESTKEMAANQGLYNLCSPGSPQPVCSLSGSAPRR